MKKLPPFWETERMIMREITRKDTDFIVALRANPDAYKYFLNPHPLIRREHIEWFWKKYLHDDRQSSYVARLKLNDMPVGIFSAKQIDLRKMEISYILVPDSQGRGLATEAVIEMEYLCLDYTDIDTFSAQIHVNNAPSIQLIERLGYVQKERNGEFMTFQKSL